MYSEACLDGVLTPRIEGPVSPSLPGAALAAMAGLGVDQGECRARLICGPYEYGEGLAAFWVGEPPERFKPVYLPVEPRLSFNGRSVFNPFSWAPLAPPHGFGSEGLPGCVEAAGAVFSPATIKPGHGIGPSRCRAAARTSAATGEVRLGPFTLNGLPESHSGGQLKIIRTGEVVAAYQEYSATILSDVDVEVVITTGSLNHRVKMIYINSFAEPGGDGPYEGVAFVVETPLGSIALSSPDGVVLEEAGTGRLRLFIRGVVKLAVGGELEAARLLAEASYDWSPREGAPEGRVAGLWGSSTVAVILEAGRGFLAVKVVNPTGKTGTLSVEPGFPPRAAYVETPLGGEELAVGPIVRVPAPPCFCGLLRMKGGILARLREKRGESMLGA